MHFRDLYPYQSGIERINMKIQTLLSIGIFTVIMFLTVLIWREYLTSNRSKEGFAVDSRVSNSVMSDQIISMLAKNNEPAPPTDEEAAAAHLTMIRYIAADFKKGRRFLDDIRDRFYGSDVQLRSDINIKTLMDNYHSPLQRV
jgi:hypothetical protein